MKGVAPVVVGLQVERDGVLVPVDQLPPQAFAVARVAPDRGGGPRKRLRVVSWIWLQWQCIQTGVSHQRMVAELFDDLPALPGFSCNGHAKPAVGGEAKAGVVDQPLAADV